MKSKKISTLSASIAVLLAAGLLVGCGDESEEEEGGQTSPVISDVAPVLGDETVIEPPVYEVADTDVFNMDDMENDDNAGEMNAIDEMFGDAFDATEEVAVEADATIETMDEAVHGLADESIEITQAVTDELLMAEEVEVELSPIVNDGADVVTVTPEIIRGIQQSLTDAGYNAGPADGISGPRTLSALTSFQEQNNIASGQVTKETLRALNVDF